MDSPPSLIGKLIVMVMGGKEESPENKQSNILYQGEAEDQAFLKLCMAICVPILLFVKPGLLWVGED
jgi:hypothetical protein